jgi:NHLM bacteriocin system ABC transporter peptidase/ATP-binding protein
VPTSQDKQAEAPSRREHRVRTWMRRVAAYRHTRDGHRDGPVDRRVRTPTILQMEAVECGAAALAMVLASFGRRVPLEELRLACGVSRDGSKANNVLKAARTFGLQSKGYKKEPAELASMPLPMILHWNFNHFVVFEGFRKSFAYLNDPSTGPTRVPLEEFDSAFTGVALTFVPGPDFVRGGEAPSLLAPLKRRLSGSLIALGFVLLAGVLLLLPGLAAPTYNRVFIDQVMVKGLTPWMTPLLWLMGTTALITFCLTMLQQRYLLRLESKLSLATSSAFFWHVLRLPVEFFTQRYAGEIGNRVGINDKISRLLSGELATTALNILVISLYAILMLQYDVWLTLVCVATAVLNMCALRWVSRRRVDLNQRMLQDRGKLMGTAMGGLQTIETLKATGSESDFFARWSGYQAKVVNANQELQLTTLLLSAVPPLLLAINGALVLGIGGLRVMNGVLTMGMLIAFQGLMGAFLSPINKMVELGGQLQEVRGDMTRLDDVLSAKRDGSLERSTVAEASPDGAVPNAEQSTASPPGRGRLEGWLELRDVTFGYSRLEEPLIRDFSLSLQPGQRVALVGGSGSGKSTVAKVVAGLYQPWSGVVLFDGLERSQIGPALMAGSVGCVDQDVAMFDGTVSENLSLWDATIPERHLIRAAQDASIHEDISARTGGYGGTIEEGGRNFSGGQRQRLDIARTLALNPSILVLDEATSALDPATELLIDDNVRRRGCTCLIIAHRLSTVRDCDEIIVMHAGKIVQRGTHAALAEVPGHYAELIAAE